VRGIVGFREHAVLEEAREPVREDVRRDVLFRLQQLTGEFYDQRSVGLRE
jgi:hypothetical protein